MSITGDDGYDVAFTTGSDDLCSVYVGSVEIDEYDGMDRDWPLLVNGVPVGTVRATYGRGWEFQIRSNESHQVTIDVNKPWPPNGYEEDDEDDDDG